jgi:GT2 family glycosyltransferase
MVEETKKEEYLQHNTLMRMTTDNLPPLDIIVPTHGKLKLTMQCLETIYTNTRTKFHLIIVDDTKPEEDLTQQYCEWMAKKYDNITYIHNEVPFKSGNQFFNRALLECKYDYVATVMNSMRVEPEWEIVALSMLQNDPKIGTIGFKCLFPSGYIESAGIAMNGYTPFDLGKMYPGHSLCGIQEVTAVQWAFALHRKSAIEGNLDEDAFNGFKGWDDIDNCFVERKKGWKIFYCGAGVGYHEPRSTRGDNSETARILNLQNAFTFYKRWGYWDLFLRNNALTEEQAAAGIVLPVETPEAQK